MEHKKLIEATIQNRAYRKFYSLLADSERNDIFYV